MKRELELQKFIREHSDWERILTEKPYCLNISRDNVFGKNLILFKYNQIETVWGDAGRIAREARGIVLEEDSFEVISYAFDKFFNEQEQYADKLDASSMMSSVKIDGSIFKIVKIGNDILMSTNGTINAFSAPVAEQIGCDFKSFGEIASSVIISKFESIENFKNEIEEGYTYIFELVSPYTRVVTPYTESDLYLIGCRNNITLEEIHFKDCHLNKYFKTPNILDFSTIEDCLEYAKSLDWTNEGFVVMDKDFHRVKVKNPSWLAVHHLCNNHVMSYERAIDIIRTNEIDEVVSYFPEFKENLEKIRNEYYNLQKSLTDSYNRYLMYADTLDTRKEHALAIQKEFGKYSGCGFALLDKKVKDEFEWLEKVTSKNIVKYLGYKE